jgi:hypothetical protein
MRFFMMVFSSSECRFYRGVRLKKLNEVEGKEQYRVEISNRIVGFGKN